MRDPRDLLKKYANQKSKYFILPDGETAKVTYISAEIVPNNFDGGKTSLVRYTLEVDGVIQLWDRPSRQLAQEMSKFSSGDILHISRIGEKSKTKYLIEKDSQ